MQMLERPGRSNASLHLLVIDSENLAMNADMGSSLPCSDNKVTELRILRNAAQLNSS